MYNAMAPVSLPLLLCLPYYIILYYIVLYYDSYLAGRGCYEVKDADDPMKCVEVPAESVIRLTDGGQGFAKGDHVSR